LTAPEAAGPTPATVRGGGQTVAAGSLDALSALSENPPERARVIPLQVAGAFHTEYMAPATDDLAATAADLSPSDPQVTILSNSDGAVVASGREYVDRLVKQVTHPVRWDLCREALVSCGITGMIELAPGGTRTGVARRARKGGERFGIRSAADLDGGRECVGADGGVSQD